MADLNEIKDINADLPLTNFPDEIDELESFSDADDEINSAIITYKNLMKQGETAKAEELYEKYSLKKYIVSAYFLNKIQHMIIACERSISSVKKYFSFSTDAPTGTTSQPNGYLWGKVLQAGDYFKKVILKLKENGNYVDIFPRTTADNVLMSEDKTETVKDKLEELSENSNDANETLNKKMDKDEPRGTGSIAMNTYEEIGINASAFGTDNAAGGDSAFASGTLCTASASNSFATGLGSLAFISNQIVSGKYNETGNYAQIIGNGTSDDDRKNIYTVDWDGNVKAKSFNASGDIIYNNGKSVSDLANTVGGHTDSINSLNSVVDSHTSSISNLTNTLTNKIVITNIEHFYYSDSSVIFEPGNSAEMTIVHRGVSTPNEQAIFIPTSKNRWTNIESLIHDYGTNNNPYIKIDLTYRNISDENHSLAFRGIIITYLKLA